MSIIANVPQVVFTLNIINKNWYVTGTKQFQTIHSVTNCIALDVSVDHLALVNDCEHNLQRIINKFGAVRLDVPFDILTQFDYVKFTDGVFLNLTLVKRHIMNDDSAPFSTREKGLLQPCQTELVIQVSESEPVVSTTQVPKSESSAPQDSNSSQAQDPITTQLEQLQAHNAYLKGFIIRLMNHTVKSRFDVLESLVPKTKNDDMLKEQRSNHRHRNRIIEVILPKLEAKEDTATKNITLDQYLDKFISSEL